MATRDKIMILARDFIQEGGVNGFSFADIAKTLDIKRASVHYYFPSKSDLIEAVLDQYQVEFFEALDAGLTDDLEGNLRHFVALYEHNLTSHKICLCSALASDGLHVTEMINHKVDHFFTQNIDWLRAQLSALENAQEKAEDFFACIQGAQLVARHQNDLAYFQRVMTGKILDLV